MAPSRATPRSQYVGRQPHRLHSPTIPPGQNQQLLYPMTVPIYNVAPTWQNTTTRLAVWTESPTASTYHDKQAARTQSPQQQHEEYLIPPKTTAGRQ
jgi:hypothetical protein